MVSLNTSLILVLRCLHVNFNFMNVPIVATYFVCLMLLFRIDSAAQSISGVWNGTVQVPLSDDWLGEYAFEQNGLLLEGYATIRSPDGKDSSRSRFVGSFKAGVAHFRGTEFIYKTTGCLAVVDLTHSRKDGGEFLAGRWKGDWDIATCVPGSSGKMELTRVITSNRVAKTVGAPTAPLVANNPDDLGAALTMELSKRNYYALIIGTNNYLDDKIVDLENPVADAHALADVLQTYYTFTRDNIHVLDNPTRSGIIEAFDALSEKVIERDQLLIFYAGHGIWDERLNQGFWLPSDAALNSKAQWLSNSTIRDYIGGIKAKHILLITDACFSGSIFRERGVGTNSKAVLEMYKLPSRKAMTSGALKTVPDKSVFITYLTKNLINNQQPFFSAEELFRSFKMAVINNSANGQVPQYGPIGQVGDEGGDFIFLRRND